MKRAAAEAAGPVRRPSGVVRLGKGRGARFLSPSSTATSAYQDRAAARLSLASEGGGIGLELTRDLVRELSRH